MDIDFDTASTFETYAFALVVIAVMLDFAMRVMVRSDRLHSKFLKFMDTYGWLFYLGVMFCLQKPDLSNLWQRVCVLTCTAVFSLCVSLYRYSQVIPKVRANYEADRNTLMGMEEGPND